MMKSNRLLNLIVRAKQNDKEALNELGFLHYTGDEVKQDYSKALHYYQQAAAFNYANAQFNIGLLFEKGLGVERDLTIAKEWYEKAAQQGFLLAQYNLANLYQRNPETFHLAAHWYHEAAKRNFALAQNNFGFLLLNGIGIEVDKAAAFSWFEKAAEQELPQAMRNLGLCFLHGHGVETNNSKSIEWFKKAAAYGDDIALYQLGRICQEGVDMHHDEKLVADLLFQSAKRNNQNARKMLTELMEKKLNQYAKELLEKL